MTMSDDGDRTCPLCAEEMDITDQQLKPCKCGYDICVWCWHHIIDMAEKDETEGRCPACRTPYDKDRIVNMSATCERSVQSSIHPPDASKTVTEQNAEKKQKTQKVKPKAVATTTTATAETKKHLSGVRVIQRNLVLERREYFGQYGKVLKVSVSRSTGPPSQQASGNNNISVYVSLNLLLLIHPCACQVDIVSSNFPLTLLYYYIRTRVPQMASSVSQRRAGTVLPPPADDLSYSAVVSARHTDKNGTLNTTNQPRPSPPNSSSGRPKLPQAASWGHRDLTGVTSSQSLMESKQEPQSNSFSSSSMISSTRIPSSWNDDTSSVPKISEQWQLSEKDSSSKTIEPYKPGIAKEAQALSSLSSSLDIDFSTIHSAWNDDDILVSDDMSKGSGENQVANGNGKLTHPGSKSPKKDTAVSSTSKSPSDFVSSLTSKSGIKVANGDHLVTNIAPKSPTSKDVNCHLAGDKKMLEDIGPKETDIEKLSVCISSVMLDAKDEVQHMARIQQPDAMPCTSVAELLPSENKNTVRSCQYDSDKHPDWNSELQTCSETPLVTPSLITDKHPMTLLDGTGVPSYSSFICLPDVSDTSLWNDTETNHISTTVSTTSMVHTKQSSTDNTCGFLNRVQDGLGTVYTPSNVSGYPGIENHQPGAISVGIDNTGSFDKTISVNKDENRIISDMLLSEFNLWDAPYSTANNFVRMLRESENNDVHFTMPSWKSGTSSKESRFAFARQDNQGSMSDSFLRNCGSEKNFSLLSQNSCGNVYQNGLGFQSLENSLAISDMTAIGISRSKKPAPPGFSAPARVPPPGLPSQDGLNPPPGFSSGIPSQDGSNLASRFPSAFSSEISLQDRSNTPSRFPSVYSSGFPSQDGLGSPSRFPSAFSSGFTSQDGPNSTSRCHPTFSSGFASQDGSNLPSKFPSAFSSGFSSQDGSNHFFASAYSETRIRDNLLGGNTNRYEPQLARHTTDIEFVDPAILSVGKGRMPGINDSGLEMKNNPAFPQQLQTSNSDQRIQSLMQQSMQCHQRTHIQDAFNIMNDNYLASQLLGHNKGSLSPYTQMPPQQTRRSHLTNGHWDGWSDFRQGNNSPMSDMSGMPYPSEANNLQMMGSSDVYNRAFGM
ncbi:hypothetical protein PR202_ga04254 [Eleusine coracana subsp. coracana]|uniref:RING-type domain-containing protein n=1 Tax=Eleusine coracana subsp. coracana TaxID=191504 RepID=A0AAV5BP56_ELECO|nr:hypothetical protein PR202_ga04254 [Eleusine coracana subsp. coracana]